jgi:uncharacterized protein YoxC
MTAWDGAILAIVAMVGGALLVAVFMLVSTLGSLKRLLEEIRPALNKTAKETAELSAHLNELSEPIAKQGEGVARFLSAIDRLGDTVERLNRMAQSAGMIAATAAPAVVAAIHALRQPAGSPNPGGGCDGPEAEAAEAPAPEAGSGGEEAEDESVAASKSEG